MRNTKLVITSMLFVLLLIGSAFAQTTTTSEPAPVGSSNSGSGGGTISESEPIPTIPNSGGGGGTNSLQAYRNAYFLCHDGSASYQGSESSCKTSDTWYSYAKDFCSDKCSPSTASTLGKCGVNSFQVYNECGYASIQPKISKEQVKCIFENSNNVEKCYTSDSLFTFGCSGTGTCVTDISGKSGSKLTWKSSCGGYAYTTIDGNNEYATFKCAEQKPISLPDLVIKNLQVYQKTDSQYGGTAIWIEYDLENIGKGDVNQGFLNTIFVDGQSIGNIWYWKGLSDDKTSDATSQYANVPALKSGESVHRAHRFFIYYEGMHKVSVEADSYVATGRNVLDKSYDNLIKESNEDNNKQTIVYNFETSTAPSEVSAYLNQKFELPRKQTARIIDLKDMRIEFVQVTSESNSKDLSINLNVKYKDVYSNYKLYVGGFADLGDYRIRFISLERTGNYLEYPNNDLQDWVATLLVEPISTSEPKKYVDVVISPEKQFTKNGFAEYDVIIYDKHPALYCTANQPCPEQIYKYNLYFNSEQNIKGELENSQVEVPANSKVAVKLKVQSFQKGTNIFEVTAKGDNAKDSSKGILIYGDETPKEPTSYFNGQGFALSVERKAGALIGLHFTKDGGNIKGKFNLENTNYKVEGTQSNGIVKFEVFSTEGKEEIATFLGTITEFDTFFLLQGSILPSSSNKIGNWYMTAFSKKEKSFVEVEDKEIIDSPITKNIQLGEIISVPTEKISEETGETKKMFIQSTKLGKRKLFGLIPIGENLLNVEIIDEEGKVTKITLSPFGEKIFRGHKIRVDSSLEDKNDIAITIEKLP